MTTISTHSADTGLRNQAIARDQTRAMFGQVMGYVAVTVGFTSSAPTSAAI
jgi:hypothetical protein